MKTTVTKATSRQAAFAAILLSVSLMVSGCNQGMKLGMMSSTDTETKETSSNREKGIQSVIQAIKQGAHECLEELLAQGKTPEVTDAEGRLALRYAAYLGDLRAVEILISDPRTRIDAKSGADQRCALAEAAMQGHLEAVDLLLNAGAAVDTEDANKDTALMLAVIHAKSDNEVGLNLVTLFLERGAEVNKENNRGMTPLQVAANKRNEAVMCLLIENGANVERTLEAMQGALALRDAPAEELAMSIEDEILSYQIPQDYESNIALLQRTYRAYQENKTT